MPTITGQDTKSRTILFTPAEVIEALLATVGLSVPTGGEAGDTVTLSTRGFAADFSYDAIQSDGEVRIVLNDTTILP